MNPQIEELIAKGYGRAVTVGAFSTGIAGGGAGTILDLDQPELVIGVPAGYCVRPFYVDFSGETPLIAADDDEIEFLVAVDSLGLWTGDGTSTAENPSNLRTDLDKGSACRVGSAFSADMTTTPGNGGSAADPVLDLELIHEIQVADVQGTAANALWGNFNVNRYFLTPPFVVGPATILAYWGGTVAVNGYLHLHWVEGPANIMLPAVAGL